MDLPFQIRKIIHVDMDAFYASVEQHDNPALKGKAIAVGGQHRGVVAAASYEARKYGVRSAMPSKTAKEKCPHLIFVPPRFPRYKEISAKIREIFYEYTDLVEPLSLDEAYLDVTENKKGIESANQIARDIRRRIFEETGLTASAGISVNKFLAKVASDINKPNGQKTIHPDRIESFLEELPVEKFYGVGKVTANKMFTLGIFKGKDLKKKTLEELTRLFGKSGSYYYHVVRGVHNSEVKPHRIQKSVAVERTFSEDLMDDQQINDKLESLSQELHQRLQKNNILGRSLTLKIKYKDFSLFTRSITQEEYFNSPVKYLETGKKLWELRPFDKPVRLLGLSVSQLNTEEKKQVSVQLKIPFKEFERD
ncbi:MULTISPECIES: DNA polymerase IV [Chryseobacterium]|uniref:DNA polymerase IV n=1 Tax=Chryseobacterium camelliae TaxID=1265445 RepID=A0ABU0TMW1_9FLAO|nr:MULTISPECIES: DNA polymerase IV [Chryseobacterium]MDT3408505.1 DNA polymerase-4 [Pseudacidovorax intermedius]MDQ1097640.1 DNA polymerase-4 [Chryseobacterium camelliae]MDQ1101569.1 DNA polymerase-4 [Chryseobacterium sp. SORGH_AS_1048]MDR6085012.1 DNA polymerase-4 [Chryseobacterium sp. SORGH_AS_0909]MDR6129366.1 DNA polymerase-4 [Chryseobacterium sp. SORGH_AS_1175]